MDFIEAERGGGGGEEPWNSPSSLPPPLPSQKQTNKQKNIFGNTDLQSHDDSMILSAAVQASQDQA